MYGEYTLTLWYNITMVTYFVPFQYYTVCKGYGIGYCTDTPTLRVPYFYHTLSTRFDPTDYTNRASPTP